MRGRASGVLLHISSLPSLYGIGDLGPGARRFIDFLAEARQGWWQILPLNPTSTNYGNSPYSSPSAFAGNPILISPDRLVEEGFLELKDLSRRPSFSNRRIDYPIATGFKMRILRTAWGRFRNLADSDDEFQLFCKENEDWLEDFALFAALRGRFRGAIWNLWPRSIRDRHAGALRQCRRKFKDDIGMQMFIQYLFFKQWKNLKDYGRRKKVRLIGDIPIYPNYDSADVWAHPEIFKLDVHKRPIVLAGIPPDYFSASGQLWNNPVYRWNILRKRRYSWWVRRVAHNLKHSDLVRLDHFQGFVNYWEVPAGHKTAVHGVWARGPSEDLFRVLSNHFRDLPFIAEDLGVITPEVSGLRDLFKLPGMRVLQFAFGNDPLADLYKPKNYIRNCVAYTGTHDNDTLIGWLRGSSDYSTRTPDEVIREREHVFRELGYNQKSNKKDVHWDLIRLVMKSKADRAIFPMQDLLGLGNRSRMNRPGTDQGNWEWRVLPSQLTRSLAVRLAELTVNSRRS